MKNMDIIEQNKQVFDWIAENSNFTKPASDKEINDARNGKIDLCITAEKCIPQSWLPDLKDKDVLCIGSGGGEQGPILAAAGANVVVNDISELQLKKDEKIAGEKSLNLRTVQGDMSDLSIFDDNYFNIIINPVSNYLIQDIEKVWKECARLLKPEGLLFSGFFNPIAFMFDQKTIFREKKLNIKYKIPYNPFDYDVNDNAVSVLNSLVFGHTLEQQIAGQIEAGFIIVGMYEDKNVTVKTILDDYISTLIATKAIKM